MAKLSREPPPKRIARITRSASREPSEGPAAQQHARSQGSTASTRQTRHQKPEQPALPTVDEDEGLFVSQDEPEDAVHHDQSGNYSQRALSMAASRTTVRTEWSQELLDNLDADLIVDRLERVSSSADDVMDFLVPPDPNDRAVLLRQVLTPHSRENKLFVRRVKALVDEKNNYGDQEYVAPEIILRAILDAENVSPASQAPWRPDDVIYKINLAQMLRSLLVTYSDPACDLEEGFDEEKITQTRKDIFIRLDNHFASAIAGPTFNIGAFRLALDITAQSCIARLEELLETNQHEPPISVIENAFLEDGYHKHAEALHLNEMDDNTQASFTKLCESTMKKLKAPFSRNNSVSQEGLRKLKEAFPWALFMRSMIFYYENRRKILDARIDEAGGVTNVASLLAEELRRHHQQRVAKQRFSGDVTSETPLSTFPGNQLSKLKSRSLRLSMNTPDRPAPSSTSAQKRQLHETPDHAANTSKSAGKKRQKTESPARSDLQQLAERQQEPASSRPAPLGTTGAMQNQKRSWLDPHPHADRVEFGTGFSQDDDADANPPSPGRSYHGGDDDEENDFDPTQDQGFQTDARDLGAADARRSKAPRPYKPMFQVTPTAPIASSSHHEIKLHPTGEDPAGVRRNVGSAVPTTTQPLDPDAPRLEARSFLRQARDTMRAHTISLKAKEAPRQRTQWTEDEEMAFIELINEHGVSWSKLKRLDSEGGNVLAHRNAEDLRWKARNLKLMWLKSPTGIPNGPEWENWDHVLLSKGEIAQLHARGVPYAQDEVRARR